MQYMVLIYGDEQAWAKMSQAEGKKSMAAWMQYTQEMEAAGVRRAGAPLKPTGTATTVREKAGKIVTTDGPFAETKEQLGGYYLLEVPNLDSALEWARKCPGVHGGSIEVRPVQEIPGM